MRYRLGWCNASKLIIPALILVSAAVLSACGGGQPPAGAPAPQTTPGAKGAPEGNPQQGAQAIQKYGCGSCHVIPGISGANSTVGPSLAGYANQPQIARVVPNTPDNLVRWMQNPQAVKPGTSMPALGVTQTDAQNIAAYLYTLK